MNRKKQIVIFAVVIPILFFLFLRLGGYHLTDKGLFYACEKGLNYGPSEEILAELPLSTGSKMIVGKWEDNLSIITMERAWGVLWKLGRGGIIGYVDRPGQSPPWKERENRPYEEVYGIQVDQYFLGLSDIEEIAEVYYILMEGAMEKEEILEEGEAAVDGRGFFVKELKMPLSEESFPYLSYLEGRNIHGEVIYRYGQDKEGKMYRYNELYME